MFMAIRIVSSGFWRQSTLRCRLGERRPTLHPADAMEQRGLPLVPLTRNNEREVILRGPKGGIEMASKRSFGGAVALAFALGCGGSSKTTAPGNITVSGQLQSGSVTHARSGPGGADGSQLRLADRSALVLAGYQLKCVTFGNPPVAASGTADAAGNVSVTIAAQSVAFGCFILDTSGNSVATLTFTAGSTSGTTLTLSGNGSLGTITVDLTSGLASASVTTGTVASTPPGAACPTGFWVFPTGATDPRCSSLAPQAAAKVWIVPQPGGGYLVSIIHGPEVHGGGSAILCTYSSFNNVPSVYASGKLTIAPFRDNPASPCPSTLAIQMTPSADCNTGSATGTFTGCASCPGGPDYCPGTGTSTCGTATCTATWSGSRQP